MDGVLIDSHDAWFDRFNAALKHFGFKEITIEEFDKYVWAISFKKNADKYFPGIRVEETIKYYHQTFDKLVDKINKMKNVEKILEVIKDKNIKLVVASNTQSNLVKKILTKVGILEYFDMIVSSEEVKHPKPDPEMIIFALNKLGLSTEEIVFVGDTIYDKQAAQAAGCGFIGYKLKDGIEDLIQIKKLI